MATPFYIFSTIITLIAIALAVQFVMEIRALSPRHTRVSVKLSRLLHYRDKAKALDRYMSADITAGELITLYDRIQKDKEKNEKKKQNG